MIADENAVTRGGALEFPNPHAGPSGPLPRPPLRGATPEILYRTKKDTVRPEDWGDAEALRRRFKLEDE